MDYFSKISSSELPGIAVWRGGARTTYPTMHRATGNWALHSSPRTTFPRSPRAALSTAFRAAPRALPAGSCSPRSVCVRGGRTLGAVTAVSEAAPGGRRRRRGGGGGVYGAGGSGAASQGQASAGGGGERPGRARPGRAGPRLTSPQPSDNVRLPLLRRGRAAAGLCAER